MKMIRQKTELLEYLESTGYGKTDYRIAVEALIFTPDGKIILEERGPDAHDEIGKLEGVGGGIGDNIDLHRALQEEISTELGAGASKGRLKVDIERLLEVRQVQFKNRLGQLKDWVVVSYLCRQVEGTPVIGEPGKITALHELTLEEIFALDEEGISKSVTMGRETYRAKYGDRPYYETPEDDL